MIHIGTSGWVYPHWREVFYPKDVPQRSWLSYYAQFFDVTEINASFYRLPSIKAVENWAGSVAPAFRFCPKISRFITHAKKLNDPESSVPRFFDVFDAIERHVGPILIQLPANLVFHEDKAHHFFKFLRTTYPTYSFSLEARHASWMKADSIALLQAYDIGWVIAESGTRFTSAEIITAKHVYLRFHGPDGSYATRYTKRRLGSFAEKMQRWEKQGHLIWAFFNNDIHGYAIENALMLKKMLGGHAL